MKAQIIQNFLLTVITSSSLYMSSSLKVVCCEQPAWKLCNAYLLQLFLNILMYRLASTES